MAPEVVAARREAVSGGLPVAAVKLGMFANTAIVAAVAASLKRLAPAPVVLDPVLAAGGGSRSWTRPESAPCGKSSSP